MSLFDVVEQLCEVTRLQADIIRKQAEVIEHAKIANSVASELAAMRNTVVAELNLINKEGY